MGSKVDPVISETGDADEVSGPAKTMPSERGTVRVRPSGYIGTSCFAGHVADALHARLGDAKDLDCVIRIGQRRAGCIGQDDVERNDGGPLTPTPVDCWTDSDNEWSCSESASSPTQRDGVACCRKQASAQELDPRASGRGEGQVFGWASRSQLNPWGDDVILRSRAP